MNELRDIYVTEMKRIEGKWYVTIRKSGDYQKEGSVSVCRNGEHIYGEFDNNEDLLDFLTNYIN